MQQAGRRRAAKRKAEALVLGVAVAPAVRGPIPRHDDDVSTGQLKKRQKKAVEAAVAAVIEVGLPDFSPAAAAMATAETTAAENAATERAATDTAAAEQAAAEQAAAEQAAAEQVAAELAAAAIEAAIEEEARAQRAAEAAAEEAAAVEAERKRQQKAKTQAALMASDGGYVDEASRPSARLFDDGIEDTCGICLLECPDAYMPCCRNHVHSACVKRWHGMGRDKTKHQVKTPKQGGGPTKWKPEAMARLHECPLGCGAAMLSARVWRL